MNRDNQNNNLTFIKNHWKCLGIIQVQSVANNKATSPSDAWRTNLELTERHTTAYTAKLQRKAEQQSLSPIGSKLVGIVWNVKTYVRIRLMSAFPISPTKTPSSLASYGKPIASKSNGGNASVGLRKYHQQSLPHINTTTGNGRKHRQLLPPPINLPPRDTSETDQGNWTQANVQPPSTNTAPFNTPPRTR